MKNLNEVLKIHNLVCPFQDLEWEVFQIFKKKINTEGIKFYLDNKTFFPLGSLFKPLESSKNSWVKEHPLFFTFDNIYTNVRPFLTKPILFNYRHHYSVAIISPHQSIQLVKPPGISWEIWLSEFSAPPNSYLLIKEFPGGCHWPKLISASYLTDPQEYYQKLQENIIAYLHHTYLKYVNLWLQNFNYPLKINLKNRGHFLNTFQINELSNDLLFIKFISKSFSGDISYEQSFSLYQEQKIKLLNFKKKLFF